MKQILFILCVFFAFTSSAYSTEYYKCVDSKGNAVLTTNPQQGMKCDTKEEDSEQVLERKAQQKAEEGMVKCVTEQSGGHVSGGYVDGGWLHGANVSGITFWRVCRDKNGKGKVVSRERL